MKMVVAAMVVMACDVVEDVMLNPFLHVSTTKGVVTAQTIIGKKLANPMGFPI